MRFDQVLSNAKAALRGKKGQQLLDKAEEAARKATDGKHNDKIRKARNAADKAVGRDNGDEQGGHHGIRLAARERHPQGVDLFERRLLAVQHHSELGAHARQYGRPVVPEVLLSIEISSTPNACRGSWWYRFPDRMPTPI